MVKDISKISQPIEIKAPPLLMVLKPQFPSVENIPAGNNSQPTDKVKIPFTTKLTCAAIAGVVGTSLIFPLDLIKTRMQNQAKIASPGAQQQYRNGFDCFRQIVRQDGYSGLYRGLSSNLSGIIFEKAIKLATNDYVREKFADRLNRQAAQSQGNSTAVNRKLYDADNVPVVYGMISGASAGFAQVVATNPMEVVKINAQMAKGTAASPLFIVKDLGLRGLYRGTPATLLRDVPFSIIFFPSSAWFKQMSIEADLKSGGPGKASFNSVFYGSILAGMVAAFAVTPSDVIKTRLQTKATPAPDGSAASVAKYQNIRQTAALIYREEGVSAFFKGATQRCMIIGPLFGITMLVYEVQQRYFQT
ncbi:hypothetical protein MP228_000440 [Amoeboaphelidium protococcarum]|nr:hypothetical protein MP228_000440 [Amoeboaphelidium protococcarum]